MPFMLSIDAIWSSRSDDDLNISWVRCFWSDMQRHSSGRLFLNFPGHAEQVVPVEAPLDGLKASIGVGAKGIADEWRAQATISVTKRTAGDGIDLCAAAGLRLGPLAYRP